MYATQHSFSSGTGFIGVFLCRPPRLFAVALLFRLAQQQHKRVVNCVADCGLYTGNILICDGIGPSNLITFFVSHSEPVICFLADNILQCNFRYKN